MTVDFEIAGQKFLALNGGPYFKFTPSISFFIGCETEEEIDTLYEKLSDGGNVLMEFAKYPFAEKYAWVNDKFGVSWQMILAKRPQKITPLLMFSGSKYGKAKTAMDFYTGLLKNRGEEASIKEIAFYDGSGVDAKDKVVHGTFSLAHQEFIAMDSGLPHKFNFTPAVSLIIDCKNEEEVTYFWDRIGISGVCGQCGWVEDKFGVSWQVMPSVLNELMRDKDPVKTERVMKAMLTMHKLDIDKLKHAYGGE